MTAEIVFTWLAAGNAVAAVYYIMAKRQLTASVASGGFVLMLLQLVRVLVKSGGGS